MGRACSTILRAQPRPGSPTLAGRARFPRGTGVVALAAMRDVGLRVHAGAAAGDLRRVAPAFSPDAVAEAVREGRAHDATGAAVQRV